MFDPQKLVPKRVQTTDILLDPNNPRFFDLDPSRGTAPDSRISEVSVQAHALEQMKDPKLGVGPLKKSIRQVGFLKMDKMVVRPLAQDTYVIVEGNRRLAAIESLLDDHDTGRDTLSEDLLNQLRVLDVLVLETSAAEALKDQWLLQGLRHISGVKGWGPYQRARALRTLTEEMGLDLSRAADTLGIGKVRAARALQALQALEAMSDDQEYGDFARPDMFSYFEEIMRRPAVRDNFLNWERNEGRFLNEENLELLYRWITPDEQGDRKISRALDIRDLADIVVDEDALAEFKRPSGTMGRALALTREYELPDWQSPLRLAYEALEGMPADSLEDLSDEQVELIGRLISLAQRRLNQANLLRTTQSSQNQGAQE